MNIFVLNGSPKDEHSITLQTVNCFDFLSLKVFTRLFYLIALHRKNALLAGGLFLECNNFRGSGKGTECSDGVFKVQNLSVSVVFIIHASQLRISVKHGFFCFVSVILHKLTSNAQPNTVFESADFNLRIYFNLMRNRLYLARLNIQLSFKYMSRSEGRTLG